MLKILLSILRLRRRSSIQKNRQRIRQPLQLLLRQQPLQRLKSRQQLLRRLKSQQRLRQQLRNLHLLPLQQLQSQQQLQQQLKNLQQRLRRLKSQQLQQRRQKVQNLRRLRQQLQRRLQPRLKNQCRLQRPLRQQLQKGQQRIRPNLVTQMILAPQLQTEVARHSCQKQVKQSLLVSSWSVLLSYQEPSSWNARFLITNRLHCGSYKKGSHPIGCDPFLCWSQFLILSHLIVLHHFYFFSFEWRGKQRKQ